MRLTRRQALAGLGVASSAFLTGKSAVAQLHAAGLARLLSGRSGCTLTPQAAEGPFYIGQIIERSDISEGRSGLPLELVLELVDASDCSALPGARVDIWHADAAGRYSGFQGQGDERKFSTVDETFLRGTQVTDGIGRVRFKTVFPGWYAGRTPHIHFKVHADDKAACIGQIYFPDDLNEFVFTTVPPYSARRRRRDTLNSDDRVMQSTGGRETSSTVLAEGDRLIASLTIGLDRNTKADAKSRVRRP